MIFRVEGTNIMEMRRRIFFGFDHEVAIYMEVLEIVTNEALQWKVLPMMMCGE